MTCMCSGMEFEGGATRIEDRTCTVTVIGEDDDACGAPENPCSPALKFKSCHLTCSCKHSSHSNIQPVYCDEAGRLAAATWSQTYMAHYCNAYRYCAHRNENPAVNKDGIVNR